MLLAWRRSVQHVLAAAALVRHQSAACACAAQQALNLAQPEPGSVPEYDQHILLRTGAPAESWGPILEREPAFLEAFRTIAKHPEAVSSVVKVTAVEDASTQPPPPGTVDLVAYPEGACYRGVPLTSLGDVVLRLVADDPSALPRLPKQLERLWEEPPKVVLLVCCHAARDGRCGAVGPPLAARLVSLVRQQGLQEHIRVYKTSHVGGHKYAGNVLVYGAVHPCDGDWYGGVNAENAAEFLEALAAVEVGMDGGAEDPVLRQWWRGRMGLSREEQRELFEGGGGIEALTGLEEGLSEGEDRWSEGEDKLGESDFEELEAELARQRGRRRS